MIEFGNLDPDGKYTHVRNLDRDTILACPHFIMLPEHYRSDGSCRCNDSEHTEMEDWGYEWNEDTERWE